MINLELTREEADALLTAVKYEILDAQKRMKTMQKHGMTDFTALNYTVYYLEKIVTKLAAKGIVS